MDDKPEARLSKDVQPWKLLSSSVALDEKWFPVRKDTIQLPSGKIVDDYFVWESPHIVETVPITPTGEFVLVQQYRHGVAQNLYQFPAGAVDDQEKLEVAALRELEEETGYVTTQTLHHLGTCTPYGTKMTGIMDIYLAESATPTGTPHYDEQEETKVVLKTKAQLLALLDEKQLQATDFVAAAFFALRYLKEI